MTVRLTFHRPEFADGRASVWSADTPSAGAATVRLDEQGQGYIQVRPNAAHDVVLRSDERPPEAARVQMPNTNADFDEVRELRWSDGSFAVRHGSRRGSRTERPVASGIARNRPQARKHAEEAAQEWGDCPRPADGPQRGVGPFDVVEEAAPWRRVYRDVRADVPVSASVREDNPSEPYALEIGDMRLSMSEATLIAVAAACDELLGEAAALSYPFSTSNRKGNGLLNPAQSAD